MPGPTPSAPAPPAPRSVIAPSRRRRSTASPRSRTTAAAPRRRSTRRSTPATWPTTPTHRWWRRGRSHLVGIIHSDAGNHSEALACCLEALDLYRSTDHRVTEGNILNTIATIHHSLGDTDRAISTYEAALTANQQLGRRDFDAITLANMAELRGQRGEYMLAVSLGEHALQLAREHERSCIPDVLTILGRAYAGLGDPGRASSLFEEALQLADHNEQSGSEPGNGARVSAHLARGAMALSSGDYDAARTDLSEALELSQRARSRTQQLEAHEGLAQLHKALGEFEQALGHQEARYSVNQELFNEGADLRIKTLQVIHDTEATRQQAEILRLRTTELEELVQGRTDELEAFQLEALQRLAILGEFRDTDTGEHTVRVGDLSAELAMHLQLDEQYIERLRLAARLHDIGKVGVPDDILLKPGPAHGGGVRGDEDPHDASAPAILAGSKSPLVRLAEEVALNHHERWDGAGYPTGFRGGAIPLSGRIVTVADVYDALTSDRPYKRAWSVVDSAQYIVAGRRLTVRPAGRRRLHPHDGAAPPRGRPHQLAPRRRLANGLNARLRRAVAARSNRRRSRPARRRSSSIRPVRWKWLKCATAPSTPSASRCGSVVGHQPVACASCTRRGVSATYTSLPSRSPRRRLFVALHLEQGEERACARP